MAAFGKAQGRIEDPRLLTGQGRYVDDIAPPGALRAVFLRSAVAHGRITVLDVGAARAAPGVHLVLTAADLRARGVALGMDFHRVTQPDGSLAAGPERPVLAEGILRFVGEPVAVVVADTLAQAQDAAELIRLDHEDLTPVLFPEGGPDIHPEAPGNRAFLWEIGDAASVEAALSASAHRVSCEVVHNRVIVASLEPRGALADWREGRLHFSVNGQGVWDQRDELARQLGLPKAAVCVTNPDVGGGFGMKAMAYPEYVPLAQAARLLGRPVRWMADRSESMLSDNAARDLIARTEIGFDADLRITAYRVHVLSNLGAYNSEFGQGIQSELFSKVFTGVYDIGAAHLRSEGMFTTTTPTDAYRGAGRPEAILTIERTMDAAAHAIGADPWDLRRRNFIPRFPWCFLSGDVVDSGDFPRVLDRLAAEADLAGYPARAAASAARGLWRGKGLAFYIEAILGKPHESARLELTPEAAVLYVGTQSNGQGHETVYTRMLAEQTGLPPEAIRIVQGDSDRIAMGGGTGGSRSVTVQGTAIRACVASLVAGYEPFLSTEFGSPVRFVDGAFAGSGNLRLSLIEAADLARARGRADLLDHAATITLDGRSFPNGAHLAEVELDPETGALRLDRYTAVDDFGTLIAPELVLGQIHGGVVQGFGQAVCEAAVYDDQGQLLSGSFMDYALPRAADLPFIRFASEPSPTRTNPLGMKGCGEAGTVGALPAICNAVADALAPHGIMPPAMPFTPARIWAAIAEAATVPA